MTQGHSILVPKTITVELVKTGEKDKGEEDD